MKPSSSGRLALCSLLVVASSFLWGCSALQEDKVNYKSATKAPSLDIPPDLTQLRKDSRYALDANSTSALGFNSPRQGLRDSNTASNQIGSVRMERQGNQRWLVVNQPVEQIWDSLRSFWTDNGFVLTTDAPDLGILETDWAENRAKIPQDLIRRTLGRFADGLYSTGERDRYRTRVERNAMGGVDIFITHRGLVEEYLDVTRMRTAWKTRPTDPELEIEFLRRLMVKLGASKDDVAATQFNRAAGAAANSPLKKENGETRLQLEDDFERSWRRVGVALDRAGFTVEDRDRSKGLYFVRYVPAADQDKDKGFFGRMFKGSDKKPQLQRYQVLVSAQPTSGSTVTLRDAAGQASTGVEAEKILKLIADQLR